MNIMDEGESDQKLLRTYLQNKLSMVLHGYIPKFLGGRRRRVVAWVELQAKTQDLIYEVN
jgi:hypothetical protein